MGRIASEEVLLQLISSKCIPVLLYDLKAVHLTSLSLASLDFVINRFFMKLFKTNNRETVRLCQAYLAIVLPSIKLSKRAQQFEKRNFMIIMIIYIYILL